MSDKIKEFSYPAHNRRPRRLRFDAWMRDLVQETKLHSSDFIWPLFVSDQREKQTEIAAMQGVMRYRPDEILVQIKRAIDAGIKLVALFPHIDGSKKDETGSYALDRQNILCETLRLIKAETLDIGVMCDIALDPFTSHGHDGVLDGENVDNDRSVEILCQQALVQAQAGADIIAPSDMMDGRVHAIRQMLDKNGFQHIPILSYGAKYASCFYGPFRDAVGSQKALIGDKKTYQMNPANQREALMELDLDQMEGADMLMVKPALPYLDIIAKAKERFNLPIFAYQVSGEYRMICSGAEQGVFPREAGMVESLTSIKRAGADGILTYFALEIATLLNKT